MNDYDQDLEPNTVSIYSISLAKYLMDKGFIQKSNCRFICSMPVYQYIQDRLKSEKPS